MQKKTVNQVVRFEVPGIAVPKARHRNGIGRNFTPVKTKAYERTVGMLAKKEMIDVGSCIARGPIRLSVDVFYSPPMSWPAKKKTQALEGLILPKTKKDLSNIVKSIEDGMNGIAYVDDNQVV
jgi:Holliday junction resolvase RusA-like endonuclease